VTELNLLEHQYGENEERSNVIDMDIGESAFEKIVDISKVCKWEMKLS